MINIHANNNFKDPLECNTVTRIGLDKAGAKFSISVLHKSPFLSMEGRTPPLPSQFTHINVVRQGSFKIQLNNNEYVCNAGDLLFVNWGAVMVNVSTSEDIVLERIAIRKDYLKAVFSASLPKLFLSPGEIFVWQLTKLNFNIWHSYFVLLHELSSCEALDTKVIDALFLSLMQFVYHFYKYYQEAEMKYKPRTKRLTEAFVHLISKYSKKEHEIMFYADNLCVTPHYLGVIIKSETGETAREWIENSLTVSMQVALRNSNKTLKQLAASFNFSSSSAFCKFFKRRTGLTPNEYRNKK